MEVNQDNHCKRVGLGKHSPGKKVAHSRNSFKLFRFLTKVFLPWWELFSPEPFIEPIE